MAGPVSPQFTPKIFTVLSSGYTRTDFKSDLIAGLTVAIVALPLAMALAIASGASPDKGLVTAVIAGFLISFFGGSRVQIGGPTGAFVVIVAGVVAALADRFVRWKSVEKEKTLAVANPRYLDS